MSNEDFFYEVYTEVSSRGIKDKFYNQLGKQVFQDKHRHKTVREHWDYAFRKISASVGAPQEDESFSKK